MILKIINEEIEVDGEKRVVTCVSMGNPHAVTYIDDVADFETTVTDGTIRKRLSFVEDPRPLSVTA